MHIIIQLFVGKMRHCVQFLMKYFVSKLMYLVVEK